MSREFGDYGGCGYFHSKIQSARDDAEDGRTNGAKIMAAILKPLAEMAYAVASEEACDSGEDFVVSRFAEQEPELRSALSALAGFVEPAKDYAAEILAKHLQASGVKPAKVGDSDYEIRVSRGAGSGHEWEVFRQALRLLVRLESGFNNAYYSGSSMRSGDDFTTHRMSAWNSPTRMEYMQQENSRLTQEVEKYKALLGTAKEIQ